MIRKLRKLTRLPYPEWVWLFQAVVLIAPLRLVLRCFGLRRTRHVLHSLFPPHSRATPSEMVVSRLTYLVDVAARHSLYQPECLERSLTLWTLLSRHGFDPVLRIGARKPGETMDIHAWVEYQHVVLNDRTDIAADYTVITEFAAREHPV